jgi:hypothetical protein
MAVVRATRLGFYHGLRAPGTEFEVPDREFTKTWSWVEVVVPPKSAEPQPAAPAVEEAPASEPAPVKTKVKNKN